MLCMICYMLCCTHLPDRYDKFDFFFSDFISLLSCFSGISAKSSKQYYFKSPDKYFFLLTIFRMGLFGAAHASGCKNAHLHKICHTYPTMMKLSTVIPYLTKIQNMYKSREPPINFCWHQYFFTKDQQLLLYQEIQIKIAFQYMIANSFNFFLF